MLSYSNCEICGKQIHGGKRKNFTTCEVCGSKVCRNCSKDGFCLEHYNELSDSQKKKIKSNFLRYNVFGLVIPIFILLGMIIFASLIQNGTIDDPGDVIAIYMGIFLIILVIFMVLMFILKKKNVRKILQGL